MHPILLSPRSVIESKIIAWYYTKSRNSGRNMTLNEIRCNGFRVINGNKRPLGNQETNFESKRWQICLKINQVMQDLLHMLT